jgi:hypothetical protein
MWPALKVLPVWWTRVMLVVLVSVVCFISACTGPGHSSSAPSAHSPEGAV